jgi:hypothetical protein
MKQLLSLLAPKKQAEPVKTGIKIQSTVMPAGNPSFNEVFINIYNTSMEVYKINQTIHNN